MSSSIQTKPDVFKVRLSALEVHELNDLPKNNQGREWTDFCNHLKERGQLTPIVIDKDYRILSGQRRYLAAKKLGWKTLNAVIDEKVKPEEARRVILTEQMHTSRHLTSRQVTSFLKELEGDFVYKEIQRGKKLPDIAREVRAHIGDTVTEKRAREFVETVKGEYIDKQLKKTKGKFADKQLAMLPSAKRAIVEKLLNDAGTALGNIDYHVDKYRKAYNGIKREIDPKILKLTPVAIYKKKAGALHKFGLPEIGYIRDKRRY